MQDSAQIEVLKERYRFDEWKGDSAAAAIERTQALSLSGNEFPGWQLARQARQTADVSGVRSVIRSTWQRVGANQEELLGVDVAECDSPAAARETLLRVLGEFQGPQLTPVNGIGDVAFGTPGETAIVFARGNVMATIRNAGRRVVPLGDVARTLDALLSPRGGRKRRE